MGRIRTWLIWTAIAAALCGCQSWSNHSPAPGVPLLLPNPLPVSAVDREFLWNQVVATVDHYFKIQKEDRLRQVGEVLLEGHIETFPLDGATLLEPWRQDSTPGYEKLHSTLQSVRRRAAVRVSPADNGYLIDVAVYKELENVDRPQAVTKASAAVHRDAAGEPAPDRRQQDRVSLGWIALGRDVSLEQQMLAELRARLSQ